MDVYIIGSIQTVLEGKVTKNSLSFISKEECMYGLGAGVISPDLYR